MRTPQRALGGPSNILNRFGHYTAEGNWKKYFSEGIFGTGRLNAVISVALAAARCAARRGIYDRATKAELRDCGNLGVRYPSSILRNIGMIAGKSSCRVR
jgi:hypothetical protein